MKKLYEENDIKNIADAIREKSGSSDTYKVSEMAQAVTDIPSGGGSSNIGTVDKVGLKQLGWTDSDIEHFEKYGCDWLKEYNDYYKVPDSEKSGIFNVYSKYLPKNTTLKKFTDYNCLICLPYINTSSVTSGSALFQSCFNLKAIPQINTSNMTKFSGMFSHCHNLKKIPYLNTTKANDFSNMFAHCYQLNEVLDLDTSNATSIIQIFQSCYNLKKVNSLDTSKATSLNSIFRECYFLEEIPAIDISKATTMTYAFNNCRLLKDLKITHNESNTNTLDLSYAFSYLKNMEKLDLSKVNRTIKNLSYAFAYNTNLQLIDIRGFVCSGITSSSYYSQALSSIPTTAKIVVKDETEKTWWQSKFSNWSSCFYTLEEAIAAGIVSE